MAENKKNKHVISGSSDDNVTLRRTTPTVTKSAARSQNIKDDHTVLVEQLSAMLDKKLECKFSSMISELRVALRDDIKSMIQTELGLIKQDFSVTTDFLTEQQKEFQLQLTEKNQEIENLKKEANKLNNDITSLSTQLHNIDKQFRSVNIEIQMVPERKNEDIHKYFINMCKVIGCSLPENEVGACRRISKLNPKSPRPRNVLVTLSSVRQRDHILSAVHRYNKNNRNNLLNSNDLGIPGEKSTIYVCEHLSPSMKELHAATRRTAKEKSYKFVWVKFGNIYARKDEESSAIHIRDLKSLEKL